MSEENLNVVVDEEYVDAVAEYLCHCSEKTQEQLEQLLEILEKICTEGIMQGNVAEILRSYKSLASELKGYIVEYGKNGSQIVLDYKERMQYVSKEIYKGLTVTDLIMFM